MFRLVVTPDVPGILAKIAGHPTPLSGDRQRSFPVVLQRGVGVMAAFVRRGMAALHFTVNQETVDDALAA